MKPGTVCRLRTDPPSRVRIVRYVNAGYVMFKRDRNCPEVWYHVSELVL